jgi:hypothetical protein
MAELVVSDTGPGLTAEARERLFLPYFSTKQRGTGLGLAITAKIVQEHGGFIRAEQNVPVGARFIVELPLAARTELASELPLTTNGHGAYIEEAVVGEAQERSQPTEPAVPVRVRA